MGNLCALSACDLTMLASAISLELAKDKTYDEILVLRNIASLIAQTLFTIASQNVFVEKNCARAPHDKPPTARRELFDTAATKTAAPKEKTSV